MRHRFVKQQGLGEQGLENSPAAECHSFKVSQSYDHVGHEESLSKLGPTG